VFKALVRARDSMSAILKTLDSIHVVMRDLVALKAQVGGMDIKRWAENLIRSPRALECLRPLSMLVERNA
jgi:hypothetical protein